MSETDNTQATETKATEGTAELPDWARKEVSTANAEAAKYRVKAQTVEAEVRAELEKKFQEDLKLVSDEKSAALTERDKYAANYEKLVVALDVKVPGESAVEFSKLLQGSNADEFKAHAETLKGMFGTGSKPRAVDPSQGLGGGNADDPANALQQLFKNNLSPKR
jgi:hypothetical protein